MKNFFAVLFVSGFFFSNVNAQFTRYIVKLKNKNGTPYTFSNPQSYLSQWAIDRRTRYIISIDNSSLRTRQIKSDYFNYGTSSFNEIHLHNGEFLHNIGLRGQGMQIAMLDNGFNNYTSSNFHVFDSANANNQILGTWDFVAHEQNVSNDGTHGMSCFSTIVADIPGQFVGK